MLKDRTFADEIYVAAQNWLTTEKGYTFAPWEGK